jgi:hypothetical protein
MSNRSLLLKSMSSAAVVFLASQAFAAAPIVEITEPTAENTVFSDTFPFTQPISFSLEATTRKQGQTDVNAELKDLGVLDIQVDQVTIFNNGEPIGSPFTNDNLCHSSLISNSSSCEVTDSENASVTVPWSVPAPGEYVISVSVKIQSDEGEDVETVLVELLNAEFPAPPAVANAYLRTNPTVLVHKRHQGCVISGIAEQHAKYETFGPKGGPYKTDLIEAWVVSLASDCATSRR